MDDELYKWFLKDAMYSWEHDKMMEFIDELKGISGPTPVWEDGELILSTPDAIGKAIERYLQRRSGDIPAEVEAPTALAMEVPPVQAVASGAKTLTTCPECGSTVAHENSCLTCKHCGWSKC